MMDAGCFDDEKHLLYVPDFISPTCRFRKLIPYIPRKGSEMNSRPQSSPDSFLASQLEEKVHVDLLPLDSKNTEIATYRYAATE